MSGEGPSWDVRRSAIAVLIDRVAGADGIAARRFALAELDRALALADPGAVGPREREAARAVGASALAVDASAIDPPPHAVAVPFVDEVRAEALVRLVYVAYDVRHDRGLLGPRATHAIARAIADAVSSVDGTTLDAGRLSLVFAQPAALEGTEIDGSSLGAAAWLSAHAFATGARVMKDLAVTGALVETEQGMRIGAVGSLDVKLAAARARGLRLVGPADASLEGLTSVTRTDELATVALEPPGPRRIELEVAEALRATEGGWRGYRWQAIRERLSRTFARVPVERPDRRVELLARWSAAERHLGDLEESTRLLAEADAIVASPDGREAVPDVVLTQVERQRAMTGLRLFALDGAERAAKRATSIARGARLRGELIKSLGALGLVELARERPSDALRTFDEGLRLTLRHTPDDAARSRAYVVEAAGGAGDRARVEHEYRVALDEAEADPRSGKEAWVRTSMGRALVALGDHQAARAVLDVPSIHRAMQHDLLPGLLARRWLGVALAETGALARGLACLDTLELPVGPGLEPWLDTVAAVSALMGIERALAHGIAIDTERVHGLLARLPHEGGAARQLGRSIAAARRALGATRVDRPKLAAALSALVRSSSRVA